MLVWLAIACAAPPADRDAALESATRAADAALTRSGWKPALGDVDLVRVPSHPRSEDRMQAILADATLAWFDSGDRTVRVTDAAFEGARWRGPDDPEAAELVRTCPARMMRDTSLEAVVLHELGHAALLAPGVDQRLSNLEKWSGVTGWQQHAEGAWVAAEPMGAGTLVHERPEIAVRLCRGQQRGEGAYRIAGEDLVSSYARFDPLEDFAESFLLFHQEPRALAAVSPARYLALATPSAWGGSAIRTPLAEVDVHAGMKRLLTDAPLVALEVLRVHGESMKPSLDGLDRPRFAWPDETEGRFDTEPVHVELDGAIFRPPDAWFLELAAVRAERERKLEEGEAAMDAWRKATPSDDSR